MTTIGESGSINILLGALTGRPHPGSGVDLPPDPEQVTAAAAFADLYATARAVGDRAAAAAARRDPAVDVWELSAAYAMVDQRLACDALTIDGAEWAAEAVDGDPHDRDLVLLTHPSGRQVTVRVTVEVVEGRSS